MANLTDVPRLLVSVAGPDGHAPLHELAASAGWVLSHETPPNGRTYRSEGFAQVAVVWRVADMPGGRVLSVVRVPADTSEVPSGVNNQWAGMVTALTAAGAVQGHWTTLAELEADTSTVAGEVKALPWPWRDYAPGDVTMGADGIPEVGAPTGARRWPS